MDKPGELTQQVLIEIAERVTNEASLMKLCTHLKVPEHDVLVALSNQPRNISAVSFDILYQWRMAQESPKVAFDKMQKALMKIDMKSAMALQLANKYMPDRNALEDAYRRACSEGSKKVFLARMNFVGFHEAGKTSLAKRLMGKDFDSEVKSTDGIALHYITSTFKRDKLLGAHWNEIDITADDVDKEVIEKMKQLSQTAQEKGSNEKKSGNKEPKNVKESEKETGCFSKLFQNFFSAKKETHDADDAALSMNPRFKDRALVSYGNPFERIPKEDQRFTIRLWDLGGQNEFLTTHHLFLDVDATTVIVMDITKEFRENFKSPNKDLKLKETNPSSPEEIMHYWLNSFYIEAKEMERKTKTGIILNIFVVLTHLDDFPKNERQERINMYRNQIMESLKDTNYAYFLTEEKIFAVDNKTGNEVSFQGLRQQLFKSFSHQQSWNQTMPVKWLRLQAEILEKKEEAIKYMHLDHLKEMGRSVGMDSTQIESFLRMHNTVGTFLYFNDEPQQSGRKSFPLKLNDFVITDPQWLVDMCKEVITHPEFLNERRQKLRPNERAKISTLEELKNGYVTEESLKKFWGRQAVSYLTQLMLTFDIFVPMTGSTESGQRYLIPCMLPMANKNQVCDGQEGRVILYNAIYKAGCGNWIHMGKFPNLFSALIRTNNWKLSSDPLPSYDRFLFVSRGNLCLQFTLEKSPKPKSNFRAVMYCSRVAMRDVTLPKTLKETRKFLSDTMKQITIECEDYLQSFCPYYGLQDKGLRMVLSKEEIDHLNCPCHKKNLSKDDYMCFKEAYVFLNRPDLREKYGNSKESYKAFRGTEAEGVLKDKHVWEVAQKFTNVLDLRTLALSALELEGYTVDAAVYNNEKAIKEAAYKIIQTWFQGKENKQQAYTELLTALRKCRFALIATELQESVANS